MARTFDAARGEKAGAGFEQIERRHPSEILASAASARNSAAASSGSPAIDRKRSISARVSRGSRVGAFSADLFEKAVGDLGDRAAADRGDAGDRQQIGDQMMRGLRIGAGERREHALIFLRPVRGRDRELIEIVRQRRSCD